MKPEMKPAMKNRYRIAGFGLAVAAASMVAFAAPVKARGPAGGPGGDAIRGGAMGPGARGLFAVRFADLDRDGDGRVTEAELAARAAALAADRLAAVDADGDGAVTAGEVDALIRARIAERQRHPAAGRADRIKVMAARMLAARDADGDGVLTGADLSAAADIAGLIDRFDRDDDNAWNAQEFAAALEARGGFGIRRDAANGERIGQRR